MRVQNVHNFGYWDSRIISVEKENINVVRTQAIKAGEQILVDARFEILRLDMSPSWGCPPFVINVISFRLFWRCIHRPNTASEQGEGLVYLSNVRIFERYL